VPTVIAVSTGADNAAKEDEISRLKALVASYGKFYEEAANGASEELYYAYMEFFGIDKGKFFQLLYEKDPSLLGALGEGATPGGSGDPDDSDARPGGSTAPDMTADINSSAPKNTVSEPPEPPEPPAYEALFPDLYVDGRADEPDYIDDSDYIYLTFDDGPSVNTAEILSYLKYFDVPATFFVIPGENSQKSLNRILDEGHAIGVHSATHDYAEIYSSVEAFLTDFKAAYDLIYEQTGHKPEIFRFPGGSINDFNGAVRSDIIAEMTRRGFAYFDWNVDIKDINGASWDAMMKTARAQVAANTEMGQRSIILMHDRNGGENTVYVLDEMIEELINNPNNYKFGKIDGNVRPMHH
jgi:peptidoglycan/xylan/chitin deacetylase (PgdA/CDA1 family)